MATVTKATKQRKSRKQPAAVHGYAVWIGGTPTQARLDDGDAILEIVAEGKEPGFYHVETIRDQSGSRLGFKLIKITSLLEAETYDIDTTGKDWQCDCKDATYTDRPGGCKHSVGIRAALTAAKLI